MAVTTMPPITTLRAELLHGLSDPSRQRILDAIGDEPRRVVDIVAATGLSQPNVSKHLRCLRGCGLVTSEKRGREMHYRLADGLGDLLAALDGFAERVGPQMACCQLTEGTIGTCS